MKPFLGKNLENSFLGPTKRNCEGSKLIQYYFIVYVCYFKGCFHIHSISFNLRDQNSNLHKTHFPHQTQINQCFADHRCRSHFSQRKC